MNEDQVRAIVRAAIARRLGQALVPAASRGMTFVPAAPVVSAHPAPSRPAWLTHPSHLTIALVRPDEDGPCLIEPAVGCNQCGYCQSVGH